jgi:tyrosine-protein kinase Etk/Wzc
VLTHFEPSSPPAVDHSTLGTVVSIIALHRRMVAAIVIAGTTAAIAVALFAPPTYTSTAVIMPPGQQQSTASALLGQLGGLASLAAPELGLRTQADVYLGLLGSRTIADDLIRRFDLQKEYRKKTLVDTRKKLARMTRLASGKDTLVRVAVDDTDPSRAAAIANGYVGELAQQNIRLAVAEASQRRRFFEAQVSEEKEMLNQAEEQMKSSEQKSGMIQITGQVETVIRTMASLDAQITAREVALQRLKAGATEENPEVIRGETELRVLRAQLQTRAANNRPVEPGNPLIAMTNVPKFGLEYLRRFRDVKYHEALFEMLAKQYEAARLDVAKESPVIKVVDEAIALDKPSSLSIPVIISIGAIFSTILACCTALTLHHFAHRETEKV